MAAYSPDGSDTQQEPPDIENHDRAGGELCWFAQRRQRPPPPFSQYNAICDVFDDIDHQNSEQTTQDDSASVGVCHGSLLWVPPVRQPFRNEGVFSSAAPAVAGKDSAIIDPSVRVANHPRSIR